MSHFSLFIDETIAITIPGGKLGAGVYDVVDDTCQDGEFDEGEDARFANAITVELPADLPPPTAASSSSSPPPTRTETRCASSRAFSPRRRGAAEATPL